MGHVTLPGNKNKLVKFCSVFFFFFFFPPVKDSSCEDEISCKRGFRHMLWKGDEVVYVGFVVGCNEKLFL